MIYLVGIFILNDIKIFHNVGFEMYWPNFSNARICPILRDSIHQVFGTSCLLFLGKSESNHDVKRVSERERAEKM